MSELLNIRDLSAGYGGVDIIRNVDINVAPGEIVTIIGPNGAGKSTLIKAIAGVAQISSGDVILKEKGLAGMSPSAIARQGMAFVPQEANVFRTLTVHENLEMGAWVDTDGFATNAERIYAAYPALERYRDRRAGNLSGGERQMLALGMALMVDPQILLVDEPTAGLSPAMVTQMLESLRDTAATGVAILMVEQNAIQALKVSDRGYVLTGGEVRMTASAQALLNDPRVVDLYLGKHNA